MKTTKCPQVERSKEQSGAERSSEMSEAQSRASVEALQRRHEEALYTN